MSRLIKESGQSSIIWGAGISFLRDGLQMIFSILLARLISPNDFGVFALASAIAAIINIFSFNSYVGYILNFDEEKQILWYRWFAFGLRLNLALLLVYVIGAYFLSINGQKALALCLLVMSFALIFDVPGSLGLKYLEYHFKWKTFRLLTLLSTFFSLLVGSISALCGYKILALALQPVCFSLVPASYYFLCHGLNSKFLYGSKNNKLEREALKFGIAAIFSSLALRGRLSFESFLFSEYYGFAFMGSYVKSQTLGNMLSVKPAYLVSTSLYPVIAKCKGTDLYRKVASTVLGFYFFFTIPLGFILFNYGGKLVLLAYGDSWTEAAALAPVVSLVTILVGILTLLSSLLASSNRYVLRGRIDFCASFLFAGSLLLFIGKGVTAVLWSYLATAVLITIVSLAFCIHARILNVCDISLFFVSALGSLAISHALYKLLTHAAGFHTTDLVSIPFLLLLYFASYRIFFSSPLSTLLSSLPYDHVFLRVFRLQIRR